MAESKLNIIVDVLNKATGKLSAIQKDLKNKLEDPLKDVALVSGTAFAGLSFAIASTTKEAIEAEAIQQRLFNLLNNTQGATKEQVQVLYDQAEALERVGVVTAENVVMAQSQLATFDLQADTIQALTPAILDYVVAEKGATATTDDFRSMTNGLAQALQGNFASLTRTGFVLDEETKALIANGTETERAEALVSVLNSTYKDFNKEARKTAQGSLIALQNSFGKVRQEIGNAFLPVLIKITEKITPIIEKVVDWVTENPKLTATILGVVTAITGLITVVSAISLALLAFNPVVALVVLAITALTAIIVWLAMNFDSLKQKAIDVATSIQNSFVERLTAVGNFFEEIGEKLFEIWENIWNNIVKFTETVLALFVGIILETLDYFFPQWQEKLNFMFEILKTVFTAIWEFMVMIWNTIWDSVKLVLETIAQGLKISFEKMSEGLQFIWNGIADFFKSIWDRITGIFKGAIENILKFIDPLLDKINKVIAGMEALGGGVAKKFRGFVSRGKSFLGIDDGVISPDGKIISTHPDDYIIATKDPSSLAGNGGGNIVINIDTMVGDDYFAEKMGDRIIQNFKLVNRF